MKISFYTTHWTVVGEDIPDSYHRDGVPFIVCLWHDRLMMAPCVWKWKKPLHVLASKHADGRLIAKVVENFSMPAVFGSTGKNGMNAAKKLVRLAKAGEYVAIIPDGPKGPRHKLAPGVVAVSRLAKADILPFSFCVKRFHRFNSWDRFILVWPFNRGVMVWEKPISAAELSEMSEEEAIKYVESRINAASQKAYEMLSDASPNL
ncbi:MAG: lysophospholipid acyltransferase family protein [Holosporaceae bacterium]|jgi:lysophospholipid acyltransferase (LPLAT)-like uncharacterized protein|nr:lysophospholipid acyltransferase family protein [Holosporaceae bacterium]